MTTYQTSLSLGVSAAISDGNNTMTTGITGQFYLEMCPTWMFAMDNADQFYSSSELEIDPEDYDGLTQAWFEVIAFYDDWGDGSDQYIHLVDEDRNIYATVTFTVQDGNEAHIYDYYRKRVSFTLNPEKTKYYLLIPVCGGGGDPEYFGTGTDFRTARVILEVQNANRVRSQICLMEGDYATGGGGTSYDPPFDNDFYGYNNVTSYVTDYAYGGYEGAYYDYFRIITKTDANWQTLDHWTLEVTGAIEPDYDTGGPPTGYAALFNKTTNTKIAGAELTFTAFAVTRKTVDFANDATNWTDGDEFELRIKIDNDSGLFYLYRAVLYATVSPATKCESHLKIGSCIEGGSSYGAFEVTSRVLYQPDKFAPGTPFYFETTGQETGGSDVAHTFLWEGGTQDVGYDFADHFGSATSVISGSWLYPDNILTQEYGPLVGSATWTTLSTPSGTADLEVSGYHLDSHVTGKVIKRVKLRCDVGTLGQTAYMGGYCVVVGDYDNGVEDSESIIPNWIGEPGDYMLLFATIFLDLYRYNYQSWTPEKLLDGVFSIRVRAHQPANTTPTTFYWGDARVLVEMGNDVTGSQLDFSMVVYERQRSGDLSGALISGNRYYVHYDTATNSKYNSHSNSYLIAVIEGAPAEAPEVSLTLSATATVLLGATLTHEGNGNGNGNGNGGDHPFCPPLGSITPASPIAVLECVPCEPDPSRIERGVPG